MTTCAECGYTYESVPTVKLAGTLRDIGPRYRDALASAGASAARRRPEPTVWSALEYACHMRDVLLVQRDRAVVALVEDKPGFARMYRDERVELCHYSDEPIEQVLDELEMAARLCALVFDGLGRAAWERPLVYNLPSATAEGPLDVAWLARHTVHEGEHHLMDVNRALTAAPQT
jgi:DinB superfamily